MKTVLSAANDNDKWKIGLVLESIWHERLMSYSLKNEFADGGDDNVNEDDTTGDDDDSVCFDCELSTDPKRLL